MATCGTLTVLSEQPQLSNVTVTTCGTSPSEVQSGGSVTFVADVENAGQLDADANVNWFINGTQVVGVVERVNAGQIEGVESGPITWNELSSQFGTGDLNVTAEVVQVFEGGTFTGAPRMPAQPVRHPARRPTRAQRPAVAHTPSRSDQTGNSGCGCGCGGSKQPTNPLKTSLKV